jgi:hypothetical protein
VLQGSKEMLEFYPAFVHRGFVYAPATSVALNRNYNALFRAPLERAAEPGAWELFQNGSLSKRFAQFGCAFAPWRLCVKPHHSGSARIVGFRWGLRVFLALVPGNQPLREQV